MLLKIPSFLINSITRIDITADSEEVDMLRTQVICGEGFLSKYKATAWN